MPEQYEKLILSGSVHGRQIKVSATGSPGTLIHTAIADINDKDELFLYAVNISAIPSVLILQWGGVVSPDDDIIVEIPALTGIDITIPGYVLRNGLIIRAHADVTDVIMIGGFANRITAV